MNQDIFEKWDETPCSRDDLFCNLTSAEHRVLEDNHQEIFGMLEKYYGYSKKAIENGRRRVR